MNHKKKLVTTIITITLLLLFVSCASTPPVTEPIIEDEITTDEVEQEEAVIEEVVTENKELDVLVVEARKEAADARDEAIMAKAPKAASSEYNEGEILFEEGKLAQENIEYDKAIKSYSSAASKFNLSVEIANDRRQAALDAIAEAEVAIIRTEKNAEDALAEVEAEEQEEIDE